MHDLLDDDGPMRLKNCRRGYMLYSINDVTIGRSLDLYGEFSEQEAALFGKLIKPGDVVIEVGANIGSHTVALANFVGPGGKVIAFEPQMVLFQNLCANVALNGHTNVLTFNNAVGATAEMLELPKIEYDKPNLFGAHGIGPHGGGGKVMCIRLDDFVKLNHCKLIKIDVEGMESDVLKGAAALIKKCKPALYVENDRKNKSEELIEMIQSLGYSLYWHLPPLFEGNNYFGNRKNVFEGILSINMLCVPHETKVVGMEGFEISSPTDWWRDIRK